MIYSDFLVDKIWAVILIFWWEKKQLRAYYYVFFKKQMCSRPSLLYAGVKKMQDSGHTER